MPIEIEYTTDGIGVISHAIDKVTGQDILDSSKAIYSNENFEQLRYWVIERSKCTDYSVSLSSGHEITTLDKAASTRNPNLKVAIISHTDLEHIRSIIYRAEMLNGGFETSVFRSSTDADSWLRDRIGVNYRHSLV